MHRIMMRTPLHSPIRPPAAKIFRGRRDSSLTSY
jgi:hypothetical protein